MNKFILILCVVIPICINGQCQLSRLQPLQPTETWYYKQFGVTNLNQLSTDQLNRVLRSERNKAIPGRIMIPAGLICYSTGVMVALDGLAGKDNPEARTGGWLVLGGIVTTIFGVAVLTPHPAHIREIKPILKARMKDVKLGLIYYPTFDISGNHNNSLTPSLILTFQF